MSIPVLDHGYVDLVPVLAEKFPKTMELFNNENDNT